MESVKDQNLVTFLDHSGKLVVYDEDTGKKVHRKSSDERVGIAFHKQKAEVIISEISQGKPLASTLKALNVTQGTFNYWLRKSPDFKVALDEARSYRGKHIHDAFYDKEISPLLNEVPIAEIDDPDELRMVDSRLKALEKKQGILDKFKKDDNPERFKTSYTFNNNKNEDLSVHKLEVPQEVIDKLNQAFRLTVNDEGEIVLSEEEYSRE